MPPVSTDSASDRRTGATSVATRGRLVGLDVARCLALLGMVTTHVLEPRTPTGELALGQAVAGGRASALFAVLAGVSLALLSGRTTPPRGTAWLRISIGVAIRAVLIAALGLWLGGLDSGIAVILTYYGLLFCLGIPFLLLGARSLAVLAAVWVVAGPVISHLVRPSLPERGFASPNLDQLEQPWHLLAELTFTGYYPAVPWLAYLLAGMAIGRADLRNTRVVAAFTALGALLALGAAWLSDRLTADPEVQRRLLEAMPGSTWQPLRNEIQQGMYGSTPTGGAWEWLLVGVPHSATPFDLAATIGSSLLVIGGCLLAMRLLTLRPGFLGYVGSELVRIAFGAGAMTLTLYTLHVLMKSPDVPPADVPETYDVHLVVLLGIGALFALLSRRGPLEWAVGLPGRWLRQRGRADRSR